MILCLEIRGARAVSTTARNHIALLRRRAHATRATAEARTAALGLALVVLEDEQIVGADLDLRSQQGLIRRRSAPVA